MARSEAKAAEFKLGEQAALQEAEAQKATDMQKAQALQEAAQIASEHHEALLAHALQEIREAKQLQAQMFAETEQLEANLASAERAEKAALMHSEAQAADNQQHKQAALREAEAQTEKNVEEAQALQETAQVAAQHHESLQMRSKRFTRRSILRRRFLQGRSNWRPIWLLQSRQQSVTGPELRREHWRGRKQTLQATTWSSCARKWSR